MPNRSQHEILVVDDDAGIRKTMALLLASAGYVVGTAMHGLDALLQLRRALPSVVISELNMPQMSGFEFLSVVRRRFPQISVIAMSGAYDSGDGMPGGVIADAFYAKGGSSHPGTLLSIVANLIETSEIQAAAHRSESAPVWIPRNGKDSHGVPYIVLTCTDCLRSFPLSVVEEGLQTIQETPCLFCPNTVRYVIDFSLSVVSPKPVAGEKPVMHVWPAAARQ
ncbi:MAG TPA: response regulator [Candidatus Angelobacter sp.]